MVGKEDERQDTPISTNTTTAAAPQFEIIPYNQNIIFAQNFSNYFSTQIITEMLSVSKLIWRVFVVGANIDFITDM
ncbi:MAG: hypothetical protein MHMPM18_004104 [Marteilia pararefringens]